MKDDDINLAELVESIWNTTVGLEFHPTAAPAVAATREVRFAGCVTISGAWNGALIIECDERTAARIGSAMLDTDAEELGEDDLRDVIGELANVIGGNLKALLPQPSSLSLPSVAHGVGCELGVTRMTAERRLYYESDARPVVISLLQVQS